TVGGAVTGLAGSGLALSLNGTETIQVQADGTFTFDTRLAQGVSFLVSVAAQPTNPQQVCTVARGAGVVGSASIANVAVSCAAPTYAVGGAVLGLLGSGMALSLNGTETIQIDADGTFTFDTRLEQGASFAVSVAAQPTNPHQICTVANGAGVTNAGD